MRKAVFVILSVIFFSFAKAQDTVPIVKFDYLAKVLSQKNDTTYVVNFWATWCKPCIKELPFFNALQTKYSDKKIKVLLVSMDFKKAYSKSLIPYIQKNNITTPVVLLDEPDGNTFIDKVDPAWSGAIPATVIFNKQERQFFEKEFHEEELYKLVESFLSK